MLEGGPIWDRLTSPNTVPGFGPPPKIEANEIKRAGSLDFFLSDLRQPPPSCLFACLFADFAQITLRRDFFGSVGPGEVGSLFSAIAFVLQNPDGETTERRNSLFR